MSPSPTHADHAEARDGTEASGRVMSAEVKESRHSSAQPMLVGSIVTKDGRMSLRFRVTLPPRSTPGPRPGTRRTDTDSGAGEGSQ